MTKRSIYAASYILGCSLVVWCADARLAHAQGPVWRYEEVSISYPRGWERTDPANARQFSPSVSQQIPGSYFTRRAGGIIPRRLSAAVYSLGRVPEGVGIADVAEQLFSRIESQYPVVDRYAVSAQGPRLVTYRFQHSGDQVSQAIILFISSRGGLYFLEVTGHRRDEDLLTGEARQLVHSVRY
jgi:hypothetical protein